MTIRSEPQKGLFDESDEPKPNSPEDLGMVTPPPPEKVQFYGISKPEPDPLPVNHAPGAITWDDSRKFRDWIYEQDLPTHARVTLGGIVVNLSGCQTDDLAWLCRAIRQVGRAPSPELMIRALKARDVAILREEPDD